MRWGVLALLLGGCVATSPAQWGASGEDPSLKRAIYECQADADNVARWAAGFGGVVVPIVALVKRPGNFNACMESRGYLMR